jgi:hypothetical protein
VGELKKNIVILVLILLLVAEGVYFVNVPPEPITGPDSVQSVATNILPGPEKTVIVRIPGETKYFESIVTTPAPPVTVLVPEPYPVYIYRDHTDTIYVTPPPATVTPPAVTVTPPPATVYVTTTPAPSPTTKPPCTGHR